MKITEVPANSDLLRLVHQLLSLVQKVLCKLCNLSSQQSEQIFTVRSTHSCTLQSALFKLLTHLVSCVNKFFVHVCENKVWPTDISLPCHLWHILGLIKCEFLCGNLPSFLRISCPFMSLHNILLVFLILDFSMIHCIDFFFFFLVYLSSCWTLKKECLIFSLILVFNTLPWFIANTHSWLDNE